MSSVGDRDRDLASWNGPRPTTDGCHNSTCRSDPVASSRLTPIKGQQSPKPSMRPTQGETHMETIDEKVKQIVVDQFQVNEADVIPAASFQKDLGADSLDVV